MESGVCRELVVDGFVLGESGECRLERVDRREESLVDDVVEGVGFVDRIVENVEIVDRGDGIGVAAGLRLDDVVVVRGVE